jgi:LDH2 family malate/lactate/ureidoglycolate dehydrogenase
MNVVPSEAVRVPPAALQAFVVTVLERVGLGPEDAVLLAGLLVGNDLRGVFSHGTRQVAAYARDLKAGRLNPRPKVRLLAETPSTFIADGDGGLGYFPAHCAAVTLAERAKASGVAAAVTRNHGHIGAAGLYTRLLAAHGLIAYCTSGHQLHLQPGQPLAAAAGGSPHSFAVPAGEEPPFVLDFGAMHDLYPTDPYAEALFRLAPGLVFRSLGLGAVCQAVGGFLTGVPVDEARARRVYPGAGQGAFLFAVDVERFQPLADFRQEMDEYIRRVHRLAPMPDQAAATLPGELEWRREREWGAAGVPVGREHQETLRAVAREVGVDSPV